MTTAELRKHTRGNATARQIQEFKSVSLRVKASSVASWDGVAPFADQIGDESVARAAPDAAHSPATASNAPAVATDAPK